MSNAIRFHSYGGPEVLQWQPQVVGDPGPRQVCVRHSAIGLNFFDVYERKGLYPVRLPALPGREAAGIVEAIGARVTGLAVGDRVAYVANESGSYAQRRIIDADRVVRLPDFIGDQQAAAIMLKGLTAHMLLRQTWRIRKSDTLLLHAAAGGVGLLTVQWARSLGAKVIAVVGTQEKVEAVRNAGADHVLLLSEDWVARAKAITRGRGVNVVYDSVGKDTFGGSLDCLRARGMMVSFGNSSGAVPPVAPLVLSRRGSLYLTRPTLFHYIATHRALQRASAELFRLVKEGSIDAHIGQTYALQDAARAHADLESRRTMGSTVLLP
jgi:NADPH2:quinone reductase